MAKKRLLKAEALKLHREMWSEIIRLLKDEKVNFKHRGANAANYLRVIALYNTGRRDQSLCELLYPT